MNQLTIAYRRPAELKANPRNARAHSQKQLHQLQGSIREFGFNAPVLIDADDVILAGHARVAAAQLAGLETVPVVVLSHLSTPEMKRAYMLADNKIQLNASWDAELLRQELRELSEIELDFDLEVTGFATAEIDLIVDGPTTPIKAEDVVPARESVAVSRLGDLWQLGDHRLLCGDALDPCAYATLMHDEAARLVFTDPPYNVPIDGHVSGNGNVKHREFAMGSGEMSEVQFRGFLQSVFSHMAAASQDGAINFICMDWRHIGDVLSAAVEPYSELLNVCVWNKANGGMGSFYRSKHELVFVYKVGTAPHLNTIELGKHGRYRTNVWDYAGVNSFRAGREEELDMHPTVKPVALVIDAIKDCSRRGEIVLDPFLGSGTTIIAAHKAKRRARAIELDPLYVDVAVRRWQNLTGNEAVLAGSDETFAKVEHSRR